MIVQVSADLTGTVWKIMVNIGDQVAEGDALAIMESMKMEIPVMAPEAGEVVEIPVQEGDKENCTTGYQRRGGIAHAF